MPDIYLYPGAANPKDVTLRVPGPSSYIYVETGGAVGKLSAGGADVFVPGAMTYTETGGATGKLSAGGTEEFIPFGTVTISGWLPPKEEILEWIVSEEEEEIMCLLAAEEML